MATCNGTYAAIARAERITDIPDAIKRIQEVPSHGPKVYHYSEEEVKRIVKGQRLQRRGEESNPGTGKT